MGEKAKLRKRRAPAYQYVACCGFRLISFLANTRTHTPADRQDKKAYDIGRIDARKLDVKRRRIEASETD